jgi:serine/threonine protein kinase
LPNPKPNHILAYSRQLDVSNRSLYLGVTAVGSEEDAKTLLERELGSELEILRRLAGGEMSELFLARQKSLDRLVAVKVLPRTVSGDPVAKARFEREAKAAASLTHPNAVPVFRFGWLEGTVPFLIMRYVNGPSLEEKLAAEGPLPIPDALAAIRQVAGALAEAHGNGFVHRDVSPSNILWDKEKNKFLISDFGLAGLLPKMEGALPRVTRVGEVVGSSGYMSPEQLKGENPSEGTDIYALGILAYELIAGEGPFEPTTPAKTAIATLRWAPRPLKNLNPELEEGISELFVRCLEKDPLKRPSAEHVERVLSQGVGSPGPKVEDGPDNDLRTALHHRRLPRTVAITGAVGATALYFVDMLADRGVVPELVFRLALLTFFCSLAASGVIAWFHGEKGPQKVPPTELAILSMIVLFWIAMGVFLFLPG